jgi:hypothetical protein
LFSWFNLTTLAKTCPNQHFEITKRKNLENQDNLVGQLLMTRSGNQEGRGLILDQLFLINF